MEKREKLDQIRRTAAEVLATAVSDFDVKTLVIKGGINPCGFYYDFIFINPFREETLPLIEERMRAIVAEDLEIKIHEMIPVNAAGFMRHNRRPYPAHFVEICTDPTVKVIQMGNFVDHVHGTFLERTGELSAFKLLKLEQRSDLYFKGEKKKVMRIVGVADENKESLKAFLKKYKSWIGVDHLVIGKKMNLFEVDINRDANHFEMVHLYWKKEGEALLHNIYTFWRNLHLKEGSELVVTESVQVTKGHKKLYRLSNQSCEKKPVKFAEFRHPEINGGFPVEMGLLISKICHKDRSHIFCLKKDLESALKSSLKFLNQLPTILELKCTLAVMGPDDMLPLLEKVVKDFDMPKDIYKGKEPCLEWKIHDDFGRTFKGPFLTVRKKDEVFTIKRSFFSSVERMIALILESHEKDLSQKKELLDRMAHYDE